MYPIALFCIRTALNALGYEVERSPLIRRRPRPVASVDGVDVFDTRLGRYHLPRNSSRDVIAAAMKRGEVFEPEVVEVSRRFIRPGTAAIDVGANFGQMSLLFSEMVGPQGKVYAIEAQRAVFDLLKKNIDANDADAVVPVFAVAFNESGHEFKFPPPDFVKWGSYGSYNLPLESEQGDDVTSMRLDELDITLPVSFMKVDVQGCDLFALEGAIGLINAHRMPILFEFEQQFQDEYGTKFQDYVDFVSRIGYEFVETVMGINYLIAPAEGRLRT